MKRLLPAVLVFLVLAALVVVKEMSQVRGAPTTSGDVLRLSAEAFEAKDAVRIDVTAPGGTVPAFVLERDGTRWVMSRPFRAPADEEAVEKLLTEIATHDAELRADDAGALRDFDLVPERAAQVRVEGAGGRILANLAVGRTTGMRGAFVRMLTRETDVRALETTADLRGALGLSRARDPQAEPDAPKRAHFLAKSFPDGTRVDKPKRLEITAPGRRVAFEKRGDAWEAVEGGPGLPVNKNGIDQVLRQLGADFHAKDLADPADAAKLGLAEPRYVLAVTGEDGTVRRLLGSADLAKDAFHVRVEGQTDPDVIYEASSWDWQRVFPAGSSLFTFETVPVPEDALTRIVVEHGAGRIELTREGTKPADDWAVVAPDWPLVPRQSSLRSLASLVRNVKPSDWVDAADLGATEVTVRAGKKDAPESELVAIRIGGKAPSGKDRLAALPGREGKVFVLADTTVDRLAVAPTSLFEPKVLHGWTEADVAAIRVERAEGETFVPDFALERAEGGWNVVRGEERVAAQPDTASKWIGELLALETREPVAAAPAEPAASRITVEKKDGTNRAFVLSAAKDGKRTVTLGSLRFPTDRADVVATAEALAAK